MAEKQYVSIGYTKKAHGLAGELKISIEAQYLEDFLHNERIFLDIKGLKIPYFVANVRGENDFILKLEEVDDRDAAFALQSREVFLREQDLLPDHARTLDVDEAGLEYGHLEGFLLTDKTLGEIGRIQQILEMPQQEMAFLQYQDREVLVPLNAHYIVSIDETAQRVSMDLPDGLLD
jgi:16S rRNA processing protein RimM